MCRHGRQSLVELLGRRPRCIERRFFERALEEIVSDEYSPIPTED